jgi:hypothetical protein
VAVSNRVMDERSLRRLVISLSNEADILRGQLASAIGDRAKAQTQVEREGRERGGNRML